MAAAWRYATCGTLRRRSPSSGGRIHGGQTTGEPCASKVARTVRWGADGKGRSRFPGMLLQGRPTNPGTSRTSPAAYPTKVTVARRDGPLN
jgi:hypothetical protein